jgi:predicted phage terminase large subunit-like protein
MQNPLLNPDYEEGLEQLGVTLTDVLRLPPEQQAKVVKLLQDYREATLFERARNSFIDFLRYMWPEIEAGPFIEGPHHRKLGEALDRVASGQCKRLIVTLPPRHTKSVCVSKALPLYYLGRHPHAQIIQSSNVYGLAQKFGRTVRDAVKSPRFRALFPEIELSSTSSAAGEWGVSTGGEYFAVGVGGAVAGRGAHLFVVDDPHTDDEGALGLFRPEVFNFAYDWYKTAPLQRLQPGGAIVVCMTRWGKNDLVGQILASAGGAEYEVINFPAIVETDRGRSPLWPQFWSLEALENTHRDVGELKWQAQYMQQPAAVEVAMVKPDAWRPWVGSRGVRKDPPKCLYVVQSWDTAFSTRTAANYSACTTWGIAEFDDPDTGNQTHFAILLNAWRGKIDFPELKRRAKELYAEWEPDRLLVEARATGMPLIQELRQAGLPVAAIDVGRGQNRLHNDKVTRVNAIVDMFASKMVWFVPDPSTNEVIQEFLDFPAGVNDDLVDSSTHALTHLKPLLTSYRLRAANADEEDDAKLRRRTGRALYRL